MTILKSCNWTQRLIRFIIDEPALAEYMPDMPKLTTNVLTCVVVISFVPRLSSVYPDLSRFNTTMIDQVTVSSCLTPTNPPEVRKTPSLVCGCVFFQRCCFLPGNALLPSSVNDKDLPISWMNGLANPPSSTAEVKPEAKSRWDGAVQGAEWSGAEQWAT